ncbi:MAG: exo-alpha-sialidase, partial [Schaalia sp.]|nr:exo-alpha-sialidase [Schaalia sp.]
RMIGSLFVHPGRVDARACGKIVRLTPPWEGEVRAEVVASFGEDTFGYSDATVDGDEAVVVFERDRGLWEAAIPR